MPRYPQDDIGSQSFEEKAIMEDGNADGDIPTPGDNATDMEVALVYSSA